MLRVTFAAVAIAVSAKTALTEAFTCEVLEQPGTDPDGGLGMPIVDFDLARQGNSGDAGNSP